MLHYFPWGSSCGQAATFKGCLKEFQVFVCHPDTLTGRYGPIEFMSNCLTNWTTAARHTFFMCFDLSFRTCIPSVCNLRDCFASIFTLLSHSTPTWTPTHAKQTPDCTVSQTGCLLQTVWRQRCVALLDGMQCTRTHIPSSRSIM